MNEDREARLDVPGSMEQARPPRQGNAVRPQLGELGGDQGGQKLVCDGVGWRLQPDSMGDGAGWGGDKVWERQQKAGWLWEVRDCHIEKGLEDRQNCDCLVVAEVWHEVPQQSGEAEELDGP